jgi:hypothetical protein
MRVLTLVLLLIGACSTAAQQRLSAEPLSTELPWNASVTVDLTKRKTISSVLYGIFFEEVRRLR